MSTHYLVDPFSPPGTIIDVRPAPSGESPSTGSLVVRIPDGCAIHGGPEDLPALLAAKTIGIQALYVGFTNVVADACLNSSEIDTETSSNVSTGGGFAPACLFGSGVLNTQSFALGLSPTQCVVLWETFSFSDSDPSDGRFSRTYVETPSDSDILCEVSFNSGATYNPTTSGAVLHIPVADQGATAKLRFTNTNTSRVYFGGWSLVY
jgi:hypothetical protein